MVLTPGEADIRFAAAYASVVEDDDSLFVGFAAGEDEDEAYVLFRQPIVGGPVWFEATDESFGATDAVAAVHVMADRLTILLRPEAVPRFGWARRIDVLTGAGCEDLGPAVDALRDMLGAVLVEQD